jgi:SagB-type dehydrogenase family enzyme
LPASRPLGETILRRGSTRRFAHESIPGEALLAVLDAAVRDLPLDVDARPGRLVDVYLLVHAVDGFAPGAYVFDPTPRALRLLKPGEFRAEGGYLCLEQDLGADASAVVFFLADLEPVLARYGDRGYRAVSLAAGLLGGRMYLAAYSLGLGATGLTFYDDDVVRFFAPDATGKDAVFVTALGRSRRHALPDHQAL